MGPTIDACTVEKMSLQLFILRVTLWYLIVDACTVRGLKASLPDLQRRGATLYSLFPFWPNQLPSSPAHPNPIRANPPAHRKATKEEKNRKSKSPCLRHRTADLSRIAPHRIRLAQSHAADRPPLPDPSIATRSLSPPPTAACASSSAAMDLLPPATEPPAGGGGGGGGAPAPGRRLRRGVGFRSLKMVSVSMDEPLPAEPVGVAYGRLANGLAYYVRSNPKPRMRAALSLAVKVGSVLPRSLPPTISRVCFLISRRVRA